MSNLCPHCGIDFTCPNCGCEDVFTTQESEPFFYPKCDTTFVLVPVRNCRACHAEWTDYESETIRTRHMFQLEKTAGIIRTKFADDEEREIYEKVRAE